MFARRVLTLGLALLALAPPAGWACELEPGRGVRRPAETALLADAMALMLPAGRALPPYLARAQTLTELDRERQRRAPAPPWWERLRRSVRRALSGAVASDDTPTPVADSIPYGQVVRVRGLTGRDSAHVARALQRTGGEAVVVHWLLGGDCGPIRNESRTAFLTPGEPMFAIGRLRADSGWVGVRPTFDLLPGRSGVRPLAWPDSLGPRPPERERWRLGPADYFELYRRLPWQDSLPADTTEALAPLRAWLARHPALRVYEEVVWEELAVKGQVRMKAYEADRRKP